VSVAQAPELTVKGSICGALNTVNHRGRCHPRPRSLAALGMTRVVARDDKGGGTAGIHLGDARCYNTAGARSRQEAPIEVL